MTDARTIHDPFLGKNVVIVDRLTDRLRGNYACGPHLPNGRPEFGFRQFQAPPIQHEAAAVIDALVKALRDTLEFCSTQGDFKNGVTHNCIDEGEVWASGVFDEAQRILNAVGSPSAPNA